MKFSNWLKKRLNESLNPELERLKREEKQLIMSMEMRKDPRTGAIMGINKAGYIDAANRLKEIRAKIKELEGGNKSTTNSEVKPVPAWMQGKKAV